MDIAPLLLRLNVGVVDAGAAATANSRPRVWARPAESVAMRLIKKSPPPKDAAEVRTTLKVWLAAPGAMVIEAGIWTPIAEFPLVVMASVPL